MENEKILLDKVLKECEMDPEYLEYATWMAEALVDSGVRAMPLLLNEHVTIENDNRYHDYYIKNIRYEIDDFNEIWMFTAVSESTGKKFTFTDSDISVTVFV